MASLISIIIAAAVFSVGVFLQHKPNTTYQAGNESDVIEVEKTYEPKLLPSPSSTVMHIGISSPSPFPSSSTEPTVNSYSIPVFPDARFIKQIQGKKHYETNTDADTVFNWYKQMFTNSRFAIRTSIKTRTNDVFTGILKVEKDSLQLSISIDQKSKKAQTTIVSELVK